MTKGAWKLVFSIAVTLASAVSVSAQSACDRGCLRTMLDRYLEAVVDNNPDAAPLAFGVRQTENAINFRPGRGPWESVTGLGEVQRQYLDPVSGQAAYYGTVLEGDETPIVTVRIQVEDGEITEGEWYVARADDPGLNGPRQPGPPANLHNPVYLAANPPPDRVVPVGERMDRDALIRIVDSYFDAITSHDGSIALTHPGCGRVENGTPAPAGQFLPPANPGQAPGGNDCVGDLQNFNLSMVVARRIPVVDVEAQVALAFAVFIRRPGSPTPRNVFSEWFVIYEGLIRAIYMAMFYPPPGLAVPNWPPFDGNWPLPAGIVPSNP